MNAAQRKKERTAREEREAGRRAIEIVEAAAAREAELVAAIGRLNEDLGDRKRQLDQRDVEIDALRGRVGVMAADIDAVAHIRERLARELESTMHLRQLLRAAEDKLTELSHADRDPVKLRKRLQAKSDELHQVHDHINALRAENARLRAALPVTLLERKAAHG